MSGKTTTQQKGIVKHKQNSAATDLILQRHCMITLHVLFPRDKIEFGLPETFKSCRQPG